MTHAYGAAFDNPDLIVTCVIGDGEAETGALATSWHSNKFLNPARDGAVLPVLHLNGFKIANPTVLARISRQELTELMRGFGYDPHFVEGDDPEVVHQCLAGTLDAVLAQIRKIQSAARSRGGGNFWDSRATGYKLRSPDADQAQGPPVDPNEMGFPDTACITFRLSQAAYRSLFEEVWGADSFAISFPSNTEAICSTPNVGGSATPVNLSPADRTRSNAVYDQWGLSLSAYEHSLSVSPFTSKFDFFLKGTTTLTSDEMAGYNLFRGKANCNSCHLDGRSTAPAPTAPRSVDTGVAANTTPVFTCFGSANLGLPKNPRVALYYETTPDFFGFTPNPAGFAYTDFGLGTFLRSGFGSAPNPNLAWRQFAAVSDGKMQTMTARDVAMVPPKCPTTEAPGPYFQKGESGVRSKRSMTFLPSKIPLIQAPMAGAQGPDLAIAVCRAGGLGSLPSAMLTPDLLREQIALPALDGRKAPPQEVRRCGRARADNIACLSMAQCWS